MAFAAKYRINWRDQFGKTTYKIDVLEDAYAGAITTLGHTSNITHSYNSIDVENPVWVIGSEFIFSFLVHEDNLATLDADFYDSAYKTLKVHFFVDGVRKWAGWLKPENTTRDYDGPQLVYSVSSTDGLADLSDVDYDGYFTTGRETFLQMVKNAISLIGIDDNDFFIQCNTREDAIMGAGEDVLKVLYGNNKNFYKVEDGELQSDDAYAVIEKCVKPFYCTIFQDDGYWKIINGQEHISDSTVYDYATLAASLANTAYDRTVTIDTFERPEGNQLELSKYPPLKNLRLLFRNINLGGNEVTNGDFESGTTGWTSSGWSTFTTAADGGSNVASTIESFPAESDTKYIESSSFVLSGVNVDDDKLNVSCRVKLKSITLSAGGTFYPEVYLAIVAPSSGPIEGYRTVISEVDGDYTVFQHSFNIVDGDGTYSVRLYIDPQNDTDQLTYYWDDVEAIHAGTVNTTTDSLYKNEAAATAYKKHEQELYFADSLQNSDISAINDGTATLSTLWSRDGVSGEAKSLVYLFAQQYLNDYQASHDIISIELFDFDDQLTFATIMILGGKRYRFIEYSKNYKTKLLSATIQQVDNTADATFTHSPVTLTSIRGVESVAGQSVNTTGFATQAWVNNGFEPVITPNTAFNKNFGTGAGDVSEGNHNHSGVYEPAFSKNTGFNKNLGSSAGTVSEGDHTHAYLPLTGGTISGNLQVNGFLRVDATRGLTNVTGEFGTVQTNGGGVGSFQGYSIGGRVVFLHNASSLMGLYDDVNNNYLFKGTLLGSTIMYYNGAAKIETMNTGACVTGAFVATGEITAYSDGKLKKGFRDLVNPLEKVIAFCGQSFIKDGYRQFGFVAQAICPIAPEVVTEGDYLSLSNMGITAIHNEAIKCLAQEIENIKSEMI